MRNLNLTHLIWAAAAGDIFSLILSTATMRHRAPLVEPLREVEIHSFIWLGTIRFAASGGQEPF